MGEFILVTGVDTGKGFGREEVKQQIIKIIEAVQSVLDINKPFVGHGKLRWIGTS